ncbi:hypothetical protein FDK38_002788 [Candidozyma auris]|nr:hypothetical protein FDK38_002788 [[Candida] auris]
MASEAAPKGANGVQKPQDDSLAMFFDKDFEPVSYVDALFQSISGSDSKFSKSSLARLSSTSSDVITHLDYHTNEISRDSASKLESLKNLSSSIGPSMESDTEPNNDNTRLQYYVSALHNTVDSLEDELSQAQKSLQKNESGQSVAVESLILLKRVKHNIQKVLKVLQSARDTLGHDPSQITIDQFQHSLNLLYDSLRSQLRSQSREELEASKRSIKALRELSTVFHQFTAFGPAYSRFIARLDAETQKE